MRIFVAAVLASLGLGTSKTQAAEARAAVASNFAKPFNQIVASFERQSPHKIMVSFGSSGKLYAQIRHGAPFDLFLSADPIKPELLEKSGLAVSGTRFPYGFGTLVLWSPQTDLIDQKGQVLEKMLKAKKPLRLAMANPKLAPYGAAAVETLKAVGVYARLQARIIQGENIGQTFHFIASANADLGFVALSQLDQGKTLAVQGSKWIVPSHLHAPIRQEAVLLTRGLENDAAKAFLRYLKSKPARTIMAGFGFRDKGN